MNPWIAKAVILAASVVMVVIRAPHGRRSRGVTVARAMCRRFQPGGCAYMLVLVLQRHREILVEPLEVTVRQGHGRQQQSGLSLLARPRLSP
jgi:hypothetical protein